MTVLLVILLIVKSRQQTPPPETDLELGLLPTQCFLEKEMFWHVLCMFMLFCFQQPLACHVFPQIFEAPSFLCCLQRRFVAHSAAWSWMKANRGSWMTTHGGLQAKITAGPKHVSFFLTFLSRTVTVGIYEFYIWQRSWHFEPNHSTYNAQNFASGPKCWHVWTLLGVMK